MRWVREGTEVQGYKGWLSGSRVGRGDGALRLVLLHSAKRLEKVQARCWKALPCSDRPIAGASS